jgi:hypothetical protein
MSTLNKEVAGMPGREELPSTLKRSPGKAQETWIQTHDSAVGEYGEGERAHRTAFASVKRSFEKVGAGDPRPVRHAQEGARRGHPEGQRPPDGAGPAR